MDVIPASVRCRFYLVYWYNIVIFWKSVVENIGHILRILQLLYVAGVTLNLKKGKYLCCHDRLTGPCYPAQPLQTLTTCR